MRNADLSPTIAGTHAMSLDSTTSSAGDGAVAVVGVGVRLPGGVASLDDLWQVLAEGRDVVGEVPADRFDASRFTDPAGGRAGKSYTAAGGFLDDVAGFDADYFGISPKEAAKVDPQQRLLLECAVDALDDAGIAPSSIAGGDGAVVMGLSAHDYAELGHRRLRSMNAYTMSGGASCNAANRLSYFFDLHGPSNAVDTACASALTAIHHACDVLRSGRSSLALTGGVNVLLDPGNYVGFSQASMLSPTGRCRPFSAAADGFVRSEGAGVLVLKPLAAAVADGDRIHAVILASGVNSDGHTAGLSLPNPDAQADLLARVYEQAQLDPRQVAYVEAHGTGTQAGDPVECTALGRVLGSVRDGEPLPIGSVKSNVGHLEAGSGVPGMLKAMLVLRERQIPATLHGQPANEAIDFAGLGLDPVVAARPLAASERPLVGVNSFGFGGANAHIVLAPAPQPVPSAQPAPARTLLVVSGRTQEALRTAAAALADVVESRPQELYDIAYTATRRRGWQERRIALLAADAAQAAAALRAAAAGEPAAATATATAVTRGRVGFVFAGNASQWPGMGRDLLDSDPVFRDEVSAMDAELRPLLGWSVLAEMRTPQEERWQLTEIAQPLLFALQAGVSASLAARGISPHAVVGHSVGEVAAAYAAGILDRASACRVIAERSRAQAPTAGTGQMAALGLGHAAAQSLLAEPAFAGRLTVAGINSDRDVTVAGESSALADLAARAESEGWYFRELGLNYAFHTPAMDPAHAPLLEALSGLQPLTGRIPMLSTVTGSGVEGPELDGTYWWRNVREPVLFADAVRELTLCEGCDVLVEVGPHPVLSTYLRRITGDHTEPVAVVPSISRSAAGASALDITFAHAVAAGADIDWSAPFPRSGRVVDLPAYPWQRERHWTGEPEWWQEGTADTDTPTTQHPLLGSRQPALHPTWHHRLDGSGLSWLADHKVGETVVVPAAAYVDMALASAASSENSAVEVVSLDIPRALPLPLDDPDMDIHLHSHISRDGKFTIASRTQDSTEWTVHAQARTRSLLRDRPQPLALDALRARIEGSLTGEQLYAACADSGLPYGPAFRVLSHLAVGEAEVLGQYSTGCVTDGHAAHPTIIDGALQAGMPLLSATTDKPAPYLPARIDAIRSWSAPASDGFVHVKARTLTDREAVWDVTIVDAEGIVSLELLGCRLNRFDTAGSAHTTQLTEVLRAAPLPGTPAVPAPLPNPDQLVGACGPALEALLADWQSIDYGTYRAGLMEMVSLFTAEAVAELLPQHDTFGVADLIAVGGAQLKHTQLLHSLIGIAERCGVLTPRGGDSWSIAVDSEHRTAQSAFQELLRDFPDWGAIIHVYGICAQGLPAVLRGGQDPLEILFSDTDALAGRFYDHGRFLQYSNRAAAELLRAAVAGWPKDRPLRILEVGAGTGGTTAHLLPHLPSDRAHFTYTDVSAAFLAKAQARFAAYDYIDYRCLDLEADPAEQGFENASFDFVVASNVLHATNDLGDTMRRVADLLTDNGQLIALECHSNDFLVPVFGLLDSYWGPTDTALRPNGPLLARAEWPALLSSCGFAETAQVGDTSEPGHSDFSVILASRTPRNSAPAPARPGISAEPRRWLVADLHPDSSSAAFTGQDMLTALPGHSADRAAVTPASTEVSAWTQHLEGAEGPVDIVLIAAQLDGTTEQSTQEAVRYCGVLRAIAAACDAADSRIEPTLWIVVGTPAGPLRFPPTGPGAGTALWGAARSLANEMSGLTVRKIALSCTPGTPRPLTDLQRELAASTAEDEILLTPQGRFVPRVREADRAPRTCDATTDQPFTLDLSATGLHYRLAWKPMAVPTPGPEQVVIRVGAAALNYRDIMAATGLVPPVHDESHPNGAGIGLECAGTVIAVGPGVSGLALGDRVAGASVDCFSSHAVTRADRVTAIPDGWSFAEAATVPTVFVTVLHSLQQLAHLSAGETVLVHGAAGGVGMAALQYAHHTGARVIATAGTPAKRQLLRLMGAEHVLDSRSLHFADQVRDLTGGAGVDVVLNSLAGQALVRSLELLKPGGRFLELGKRDFLADNSLPLAPFINNITFHGVDVTPFFFEPSAVGDDLITELQAGLDGGKFHPLPHLVYPAARIEDAFACLQHSRHLGKVVVTFDQPVPVPPPTALTPLDPDATYLITGGTGGFGAATALHLADRGARHLILISRRGQNTPDAEELLADLDRRGAQATMWAADAADPDAMRRIFKQIDADGRRLAGVIHAAMVLNDAPLASLTDGQLHTVLHPKIAAGNLLDELTRDRDLDFFVVYSSISTLVGNSQQAPYVAANLALEALVLDRVQHGLPGQAVRYGAIADAGYVQRNRIESQMDAIGMTPITSQDALTALDEILARPHSDTVTVGDIHWDRFRTFLPTLEGPRYQQVLPATEHGDAADQLRQALSAAGSEEEALALAEDALAAILAHVLQTSAEHIDRTRRLDQLGVDSLMAAEIAALVQQRFGRSIPTVEMTSAQGLNPLARRILTRTATAPAA